jgi:cysteate synthase
MSGKKNGNHYNLKALCCGKDLEDDGRILGCPECRDPHLLRASYKKKQLKTGAMEEGLYRFSDWLPIQRELKGSSAPVSYKSEGLAKALGMNNLWITCNGWWPEKGASMKTGTFKECEAYAVCARIPENTEDVLVVASAGNTARAFMRVCSENNIPLVVCVPEDNLNSLWSDAPGADCIKVIACASGSDYFDAIALSNKLCEGAGFYPEGGAKNPARRDGMGTTVLSAAIEIGKIPEFYFQAVGSGTGAIAAWEAALRLEEDGNFGRNKMKLMVSQNVPFQIIHDSWKADSRTLLGLDNNEARQQSQIINAKVLSNRKPPYSLPNGLYDALKASGGDVLLADNEEAEKAALLFEQSEGNDISPAAAVAVASLIKALESRQVHKNALVMLNITGGGMGRYQKEHTTAPTVADLVFSTDQEVSDVIEQVQKLF